ncbi:L-aspartate oxidase [Piscirickettsia salmonis]|uniref:L-aspartate oxidase n=1 Tax=Piscirickettsia salmonis TaxID=1238 RepID=A0A9Q6PTK6_PISSA|nr:L-aspartate oxidase [Piscirickettsia salmonis]QGN95415.1 L-aspartate oxidase [Piscirickettsia salmonis]QGO05636.1 L-aspartate oxidase [Piscirickettsia salmonis]QGO33957.1 L-aspartate oxidase [Piscirickettsia salmonis]QGO37567.1 L-aspartate oxidase [Piscirickettsia salmonis]QGO41195.1 L-aspartate oxidase [Piscirickettsia salmonis]
MKQHFNHDITIIGSGAAGISLALRLAGHARVALLTKSSLTESSTLYAQGGVAAVLDEGDSLSAHIQDTLSAGAGLCNEEAVRFTIENARECIHWLIDHGVQFTRGDDNEYHLTLEGGHSHRRVIHAADATGHALETTLADRVRTHPNITIFEYHTAIDLIKSPESGRCSGFYAYNAATHSVDAFSAKCTVLATGGANKVYLYSSNPDVSSGDGIAMAWRAGCKVANLEFNQFHPTCLYHPKTRSFLISEALRGEGAHLLLPDGNRFMPKFDERAELAPRDIVARAIDHEMKRLGIPCVYLDISHKDQEFIINHFPTIYARCLDLGINITKEPIPVVPAAHYTCGGVMIDHHAQTDIPGLYACGEVSYTGLHGANRLASNSLLECFVYAAAASQHILAHLATMPTPATPAPWDESQVIDSDEQVMIMHNWDEVRRFMWDYVGIVRSNKRLARAQRRIALLQHEINDYYSHFKVSNDLLELRNLTLVAELIIESALNRHESRGLHYTLDYPQQEENPKATVLIPPH